MDETIGWSTFGDLKTMGYAERFTLIRDLNYYKNRTHSKHECALDSDIYLSRVVDDKLFETVKKKIPAHITRIFDSKTQGHDYHNYILAIALLIESRFPGSAVIFGDVSRGQMKVAVEWANTILKKPIQLPDMAVDERLLNRISKHFEDELTVLSVFSELTMSNKKLEYGQFLRNNFSEEALNRYFLDYFKSFKMNTLGLVSVSFDYLNMGFSLASLCDVCVINPEGPKFDAKDFVQFILRQQFHLKEPPEITELKPYLKLSTFNADSQSPDTINSLFGKTMFKMNGLNAKDRVFIPLETLKETFMRLFEWIDVDALLNELNLESNEDEYPVEMLAKAKELVEYNESAFFIDDFDTLVQWQHGHAIADEIKEFLLTLRRSKDQLIDHFPDSSIEELKDTIEKSGYDRKAPLMFFFKGKFYIKKTSWDYFLEHANDSRVNNAVLALVMLDAVNLLNDSNTDTDEFRFPLINNTELFEYVFFSDEFLERK